MARIEKRVSKNNKVSYRARVRVSGHEDLSATFEKKTDAAQWAAKMETEIREGRYFPERKSRKKTLGDLIDRYINEYLPSKKAKDRSKKDQIQRLGWWKEMIGNKLLKEITPILLTEHRDLLYKNTNNNGFPISATTVNHYLVALSHVLKIAACEWDLIKENPMNKVKKPKKEKGRLRYLNEDELQRLLQECQNSENKILYMIVVLALSTGARKSEIMNLETSNIDLKSERIYLEQTKNNTRRALPLKHQALQLMKEHMKIRRLDTKLLFPGTDPQKPYDIRTAWEQALKRAKIENFRFHDLRHTAASYLAMNGASLLTIADILGHKNIQMTQRYSHLSQDFKDSAVEDMNQKLLKG